MTRSSGSTFRVVQPVELKIHPQARQDGGQHHTHRPAADDAREPAQEGDCRQPGEAGPDLGRRVAVFVVGGEADEGVRIRNAGAKK